MGGGGPLGSEAWQGCNVNDLTDLGRFDPISGFPVYKTLLCRIRKVEGTTERTTISDIKNIDANLIKNAFDFLPPLQGEGRGGDGLFCGISVSCQDEPHPHPSLPLEGEGAKEDVVRRDVYLDNNATTPVSPKVCEAMLPFLGPEWGNPSSIHQAGSRARSAVETARRIVAQGLNCTARRIVFTGGGSEADNLAIFGTVAAYKGDRRHLITSSIEHPAVLAPFRALVGQGYELTLLPVNREGVVEPESLVAALRPDTLLVSVMLANNETGALQPVAELAEIAHRQGAFFHCDAVQGFGKFPIDVEDLGVDLLAVSAHKLHGPKGVGALYVRREIGLEPLIRGGGQEHGLRAGTENVAGIAGFGKAVEMALVRLHGREQERMVLLRDRLELGLINAITGAVRNGPERDRLCNTLNITLPGIRAESLVLLLDRKGIAFSSGSACKSGNPDPSHALLAMGLTPDQAHCSARFSLGYSTTEDDIDYCLEALRQALDETGSTVRFVPCR